MKGWHLFTKDCLTISLAFIGCESKKRKKKKEKRKKKKEKRKKKKEKRKTKKRKSKKRKTKNRNSVPLFLPLSPRYRFKDQFFSDFIAAISVGLILVPQCLSYSLVMGVSPLVGMLFFSLSSFFFFLFSLVLLLFPFVLFFFYLENVVL